jgi:hypothetical protein
VEADIGVITTKKIGWRKQKDSGDDKNTSTPGEHRRAKARRNDAFSAKPLNPAGAGLPRKLPAGGVNRAPTSLAQRSAGAIGQFSSREPAHTVEIPQRCHPAVESRDFLAVWSVLCFGYPYCNG